MTNPRRSVVKALLILVALFFAALHAFVWYEGRGIVLPPHDEVEVTWPEQNWTPDDWQWFYHASQGGAFGIVLPYKWLMALEQPKLHPLVFKAVPRFMEKDYISRFGFLPNDVTRYDPDNLSFNWALDERTTVQEDTANNPDKLPVGFVRTGNFPNPITARSDTVIGFTCAACHTGQLNHNGVGIRIEGGPALTNLTKFEKAIGLSLAMTTLFPFRFNRFANTVLPEDHTASDRDRLKTALKSTFRKGKAYKDLIEKENIYPTEEGFGRLDALGRIGNFVFGSEIDKKNYVESNAPVNFPHIWDTPWFDWVQYNGSIKQPLVRNAGEAMGVFANVDFDSFRDTTKLFASTINFTNLYEMEQLIRGETALSGLQSPKWPEDIFGAIDRDLAAKGRDLYEEHCQYCHLPPRDDTDREFFGFGEENWTEPDSFGNRYLNLKLVNLYTVGTDPNTAVNFAQRIVELGALGEMARDKDSVWGPKGVGGITTAGVALPFLVEKTIDKGLDDLGIRDDENRNRLKGYRDNDIQAPMAYLARPLNGVWATAPFLHNGSVPNLYQLLSPHSERDEKFYLGSKEFDPEHVGLSTAKIKGGFELDTSHPGNSNRGHQFEYEGDIDPDTFEWWALPKGVIGPKLAPDERWAIIEFLKTQ